MSLVSTIIKVAPALALAGVLAFTGPTYARGGGHGGGGHGGGHGGGFHGGGFRAGGFHGGFVNRGVGFNRGFVNRGVGFNRGFVNRGIGFRRFGFGGYYPWFWGWGYPGYGNYGYGGGYYYPNYYTNYNYYGSDYDSYPNYPYYYTPDDTGTYNYQSAYPASSTPQNPNAVRLNVWVPAGNAQVWIDNTLTQQTGTYRVYETPALQPGSQYSYTVKAKWMENGKPVERSQTVHFHAGESVNVNLTVPS